MTRLGIEPRSPKSLANTLTTWSMDRSFEYKETGKYCEISAQPRYGVLFLLDFLKDFISIFLAYN